MKSIFIIFCMLVSNTIFATNVEHATIVQLDINKNYGEFVFIKLDTHPDFISCAINHYWSYTMPLVSDMDKAMYSALLSAFTSGTKVTIGGTNVCSDFPAIESAQSIRLEK